ncbi:hypothetical protein [Streptacidiphilus melanogenes]|uniref:hypothetical protein n=1 Tax=Streptacidiphilus melanogenes TaxID=411235 RepID=UPI0005AA58B4|nr:hypothetical protein [Streptacidiphilus melanogenes]
MTLASVHSTSTLPSPLLSPEAREDLNRYAEAGGFTLRAETHPWYAAFASVSRLDEARAASTVLAELRGHNVPDLQQAAERLATLPDLATPTTVRETATAVALLLRVRSTLEVLRPEAYAAEADTLDALLAATATSGWRAERGVSQSWWQRTRLARRARSLTAARGARRGELHDALAETAATRTEWAALTGTDAHPALPGDATFLDAAGPAAEAALTGLDQLTALVRAESETVLADLPFAELVSLLDQLASDEGTLYRLPRLRELHDSLTAQGLGELLSQLTDQQADVTATAAIIAQRTALDPDAEAALAAPPAATPEEDAEVSAEAEAEPTVDVEPELAADADADAVELDAEAITEPVVDTGVETESATDIEPELETEPVADTAVEPEAEVEAELIADTEPVSEAEPVADADAEAVADAPAGTEPAPSVEVVTPTETEPQALIDAQPDAEPVADATVEVEATAQAEPIAEAVVSAEADAEPAPSVEVVTLAETEPQALVDARPDADAEADTTAQPDAEPIAEGGVNVEATAQAEPIAETEPQALVDAQPATDAEADTTALPDAEPIAEVEVEVADQAEVVAEAVPRVVVGKPDFTPGKPVTAYSAEQLEAVVRWIDGDGVDRTDDELLRAAMKELGFSRLGPRIKEALGVAVAAARG